MCECVCVSLIHLFFKFKNVLKTDLGNEKFQKKTKKPIVFFFQYLVIQSNF